MYTYVYMYIYIYIYIYIHIYTHTHACLLFNGSSHPASLHPREFAKGGLVKGGLAISVLLLYYYYYYYCWTPFTKPPFVNSRHSGGVVSGWAQSVTHWTPYIGLSWAWRQRRFQHRKSQGCEALRFCDVANFARMHHRFRGAPHPQRVLVRALASCTIISLLLLLLLPYLSLSL